MNVEPYILYLLPLLARVALSYDAITWTNLALSQVSMVIVLPTTLLPRAVTNALREHVFRHAIYAIAFTIAVLSAVHLDRLEGPFLTFCVLGIVTLWWFVVSHTMQNSVDECMNTHQGDISVLPLTLVAIATFVLNVPDAVFRLTRSTIFAVPIIVAWATMFFLAFQDFAHQGITTHEHPAFSYHAYAALVIATTHLLLIETNASAHVYQFFPFATALFCQCIPVAARRPTMRPRRRVATVTWVGAASLALFYAAMRFKVDEVWVFSTTNVCVALVLPPVNGDRWVGPGCALATLATWSLYATESLYDLAAIAACHYVVLLSADAAVHPVLRRDGRLLPPGTVLEYDRVTCRVLAVVTPHPAAWWSRRLAPAARLLVTEDVPRVTFATWVVPVIRLQYKEVEVTLRGIEDTTTAVVRATVVS